MMDQFSKLTGADKGGSERFESSPRDNHDGGAGTERELTVNTSSPNAGSTNSAEAFLLKTFESLGTPSFITAKYIKSLRDDHVNSIERLRNFDEADWKRHGVKQSHIAVIRKKLMEDGHRETEDDEDDEDDDDELSFGDDDGWDGTAKSNDDDAAHNEQNEST